MSILGLSVRHQRLYAPVLLWLVIDLLLGLAFAGIHVVWVEPAREEFARLEADWVTTRQQRFQALEAQWMKRDLDQILTQLPGRQDFLQFPLAISEEAKKHQVNLSSLSYSVEKTVPSMVRKAMLSGPMTGRYGDIRRFIAHLEASDQLLFIEDLDVARSARQQKQVNQDELVTVNLKLATYVKERA
ncbi:type 4a pilus biogenesis protein PilO [Nitrospira sp. Nam80]